MKLFISVLILFIFSTIYYGITFNGVALFCSVISFFAIIEISEKTFGYPFPRQTELANKTLEEAKENIALLIKKARQEIIIVTGHLSHKIYDSNQVLDAFKEKMPLVINKDLTLRVYLTNSSLDPRTKKILNLFKQGEVPIYKIKLKHHKLNHFIVVDHKHVRLEEGHAIDSKERKALLHFNNPYLAKKALALLENIIVKNSIEKIKY